MPLTQQQLRDRIASDLMKKYYAAFTAAQLRDALVAMDAPSRTNLLDSIRRGQEQKTGELLHVQVRTYLRGLAEAEADTIVADSTLSANELNRWLGDG